MSGPTCQRASRAMPAPDSAISRIASPSLTSVLSPMRHHCGAAGTVEERPAVHVAHEAEAHQIVVLEIGRRIAACHVCRDRRARPPRPCGFGQACAPTSLEFAERPGADGDVGAFLHQVDDVVVQHQVDGDFGKARQEIRQQRDQPMLAEGHIAVDAQPPARCRARRRLALGRRYLGQDAHAVFVERRAFGRELQLPCRAVDQASAETVLEPAEQLADRRGRHAERARRTRQACRARPPARTLRSRRSD